MFGVPITVPSTVVTLLAKIALIKDDDEVPVGDDVTIDVADETSVELVDCRMFVRFGVIWMWSLWLVLNTCCKIGADDAFTYWILTKQMFKNHSNELDENVQITGSDTYYCYLPFDLRWFYFDSE